MFRSIADSVLGFLASVLTFLHDLVQPVFGIHSWGWSIILLTLIVRVLLLPLAIKQTRSMRGMQAIQPKMKEIQAKYKVDRELMRTDPEKYRARRQKMNEEMMRLYQEEGVNPAASCLPLLAQAPIFIALFWGLREMQELSNAPFYFFTSFISADAEFSGLGALVSTAGWPGWLLIVVMSGTMFVTQKQMMARTAATGAPNPMAQQQKILLYVMPLFLAVISFQFMLGLLLYWVTTNIWQVVQQWIILREVRSEAPDEDGRPKPSGPAGKGGATSGRRTPDEPEGGKGPVSGGEKPTKGKKDGPDKAQSGSKDGASGTPKKGKTPPAGGEPRGGSSNRPPKGSTGPGKGSRPDRRSSGHLPKRGGKK